MTEETTRPDIVNNFTLTEVEEGRLLVLLPDLGVDPASATFSIKEDTLILFFDNDESTSLSGISEDFQEKLTAADLIFIAETEGEAPIRCYEATKDTPSESEE